MKIKKHIPNILSSLRLLSPAILIPSIISGNYLIVGIFLSCFFTTDALDGFLARKWHVESDLGAKIDAVADKLMLASFLIPLLLNNPLIIINLILEGLISLTNVIRKTSGGKPRTVQIGRIKMVCISFFTIMSYLITSLSIPLIIYNSIFALTTVLQVFTLNEYIKEAKLEKSNSNITLKKETATNINKNKEIILSKKSSKLINLEKQKKELQKVRNNILNSSYCEDKNKVKVKNLVNTNSKF